MELCCKVNATATCKTCGNKFCPDHVYSDEPNKYSFIREVQKHECFSCYDIQRMDLLSIPRKGMTVKEMYHKARLAMPKGYMNITINLQDGQPGKNPFKMEWQIYHESTGHFRGDTPEAALGSFLAKVKNEVDPQQAVVDTIDV